MTDTTAVGPAPHPAGPSDGDPTSRSTVREITNLAWPQSIYSSAHRPITTTTRLLTGLWIGPRGWAAVHLPLHRTQTLDATTARLGIQAVGLCGFGGIDDTASAGGDPRPWVGLDRLVLAARRQAIAVAGRHLGPALQRAHQHLAHAEIRAPGTASLLPEWPDPSPAPPTSSSARARLLELAAADLPETAAALLTQHAPAPPGSPDARTLSEVASGVVAAAAVALAAAAWIGAYDLDGSLDLAALLEDAIGDQLVFARDTADAAVPASGSLR